MTRLLDTGCTADGTMTATNPLAQFFDKLLGIRNLSRTTEVINKHPEFVDEMARMMAR